MTSTISFGAANSGFQAGIIHGPVNTAFHLPPERPETPPHPSAVIPFSRDTDFVERGATLDHIYQICAGPDSRAALVGLGGVGKSQLAIEHAYRTHERSPETWVFWIHASNAARFEQSYRDIADCVKILGRRNPKANIFKLVHDWLRASKERWLLVLDNVDDARFLLDVHGDGPGQTAEWKSANKPLREYLPHCERGLMLVTTRSKEAALKLVEQRNIIAVEPMDKAQAEALCEKKLGVHGGTGDIAELAAVLEYMPLAIVQAAAYILERAPRFSVAKYLDEFKKSERKRSSLLNYDEGQLRRDWEAKNSIIVTWQISFEHMQQIRPSAADLLSLMSFFDRQGIPEAVLRRRSGQGDARLNQREQQQKEDGDGKDQDQGDRLSEPWDEDWDAETSQSSESDGQFDDDIVALRNFCFISANADGVTFEMHALIQLATRKWLAANGKLERWKQQFVSNLCEAFPTTEHKNWTTCQTLLAHVKSAAEQQPESESSLAEWATLLCRAAWYACLKGSAIEAEKLALKSLKALRKTLGGEHEETLRSMSMVASAYSVGGRWNAAEELQLRVMEMRRKKLGADHPDTLASMIKLAKMYWDQGHWDAAEELQVQVLEINREKLGADHPDTLNSIVNLAWTYLNQGQQKEAEELQVEVIEISRKKLGAEHRNTLVSMGNLSLTYSAQGRWDNAEKLQSKIVETCKKTLGEEHLDTLTSMALLADTYLEQGKWKDVEALEMQVIETRRKKLGADHPNTLNSMYSLALTYCNQDRWDDAKELQVQVIEIRKRKLGADHPDTLNSMSSLAQTYSN